MTSIEREKTEAMERKAKVIRVVWLREREEARTVQISANAELRRSWKESDNWDKAKPVSMPTVSGKGDKSALQRLPTWLQYISNGIAEHICAVASRLKINRAESTAYVMNLIHRIATGKQKETSA